MLNWNNSAGKYVVDAEVIDRAFELCASSPFIKGNRGYQASIEGVKVSVDVETDEINAAAISYGNGEHMIEFNIGILRWISAAAVICTCLHTGESPSKCRKMFKWCSGRITHGKAGSDFVERFVSDFDIDFSTYDIELEYTYAVAITAAIMGHEMGHICLNHAGYDPIANSSNRNIERSADLFAASVLQSHGANELYAVAAVFAMISLKYLGGKSKNDGMYSHPAHDERINNMIDSFSAQLSHSKITEKMLRKVGDV